MTARATHVETFLDYTVGPATVACRTPFADPIGNARPANSDGDAPSTVAELHVNLELATLRLAGCLDAPR